MLTKRSPAGAKTGSGCLILCALPVAAIGVGMGVWLFSSLIAHGRMRSWQETPATIVWTKLESHSGSEGGVTYEATAEYTYQYAGRQYSARRVGLYGGSDNFGSYHQDVHRQLSEHQKSGRPFRCYVNPDNPAEAILFRDLRWWMVGFQAVCAAAFGGAAFGMLAFGIAAYRKEKHERALAALHPDEPWLCKTAWADGKIKSSTVVMTVFRIVFAFFWNVISIPLTIGLLLERGKNGPWIYLVLVFPIVGVFLILSAIKSVLSWRKYAGSVFEMASVPGVIGGQLAGVIRVPVKVAPQEGFRLTLNCVKRVTTNNGQDSNTSESVLWQDEQLIAHEMLQNDPERSAIPALFQIPYECQPTDETEANSKILWRLEVSAKTPGLDFAASFEVPVFKTPESDPNFKVDRSLIAPYAAPEDPDRDLCDAGVIKTQSPSGDGLRLVFPMARAPGMAIQMMVVGLVFAAVPIVMFHFGAEWWLSAIFGVVFGLIGLVLLAFSADVWFYRSALDVSPAGLTIVGGLFGRGRQRRIARDEIEKVVPLSRMTSRAGQGEKVYYDIDVVCSTGEKVTAGKRILGKRLAESVIRQIEQALGERPLTTQE
jgi:hypothetical protein